MRKLLLYLMLFSACSFVRAENIYIVGTTIPASEVNTISGDCFSRLDDGKDVIFFIDNKRLDYMITFNHMVFEHRKKPDILSLPISALNNLETVIKAEELMQFATADMAYNWMLNHLEKGTKLYIIDRRDFYKTDPDLAVPNMMKVVEVEIWYEDIPDHIKGSVPILK